MLDHPEIREHFLQALESGMTDRQAAAEVGVNEAAVRELRRRDEAFATQYTHARQAGYMRMGDEIVEIADEPVEGSDQAMRQRTRIDTRRWLLSKALPKVFGDKLQVESKSQVTVKHELPSALRTSLEALTGRTIEGTAQPTSPPSGNDTDTNSG